MIKINNKLIVSGLSNKISVFDINNLTLDTIIILKNEIFNIYTDFYFSNEGKIFALFEVKNELFSFLNKDLFIIYQEYFAINYKEIHQEGNYNYLLKEISFGKETNEMTINKDKNITFFMGYMRYIFNFKPYINKGYIFISDKTKFIIYKKDILENQKNNKLI